MPRPVVARGVMRLVSRANLPAAGLIACVALAATGAALWLMRGDEGGATAASPAVVSPARAAPPGPAVRPTEHGSDRPLPASTPLVPAALPDVSVAVPPLTSAPFDPALADRILASGVVVDEHDRPVPHARVIARRRLPTVDPLGVDADGADHPHPTMHGREIRLPIGLGRRSTAFEAHPEEPVAAFPLEVVAGEDLSSPFVADAGPDGRFTLYADAGEDEEFFLRASTDCCRTEAPIAVTSGAADVVVKVRCFAALTARVEIGGRRLGPEDVRVRIVDAECVGRTAFDAGSGRAGFFRAEGLAPGPATIEVYAHGGAEPVARIENVVLATGCRAEDARLDPIDLDPFARSISVRVTDSVGRPVPGASVRKTTDRAVDFGSEPSCRSRMSSAGSFGACGVVADRDGLAAVIVRREGEELAVSCAGYVSARLESVRDDRGVRLARYRTIDVMWTEPPPFELAAAEAADAAPWWDVLLSFEPSDGGAGWTTVYSNVEPRRLYCEQQGTFRCEFRVHAGASGLPFDFVERPPWTASFDVKDVDEEQLVRLAPPTLPEISAVMPRLLDRVRSAQEAAARRAETSAVR